MTWSKAVSFGQSEGVFKGVSLTQSNYGDENLEVVAEKNGLLFHYFHVAGKRNGLRLPKIRKSGLLTRSSGTH